MKQTQTLRGSNSYQNRRDARYEQEYVYGNVAHKMQAVPKETPERQVRHAQHENQMKRQRQNQRVAKRNQKRAMAMTSGYVLFLSVATIMCALVCFMYIYTQTLVSQSMKDLAVLETQLEKVQTENNLMENQIASGMKIDKIKYAAEAYGMTYPTEGQIVHYNVNNSDYMDQYSDVPTR